MDDPCRVCGAPEAETHFGGICCRACAAFFRRYFHSTKCIVGCTCKIRQEKSHPCRECRIQKCIAIGMTSKKIQNKRESHSKRIIQQLKSTETILPLPLQIPSRDNPSISNVVVKWIKNHEKNGKFCGKRMDELTYYQMSVASKYDCRVMWSVMENVFPQLEMLTSWDKDALLRNFQPKWSFLSAAVDFYKNREAYSTIRSEEDYCNMIVKFYNQSTYEDCEMEPEEILRIFMPFQSFYGLALAVPISQKKFDSVEFTALAMLALFDGAHINISPEVAEICHNIRKLVLRELRGYHSDMDNGEMRFIETIDTLQLIEKGESKFQEELLLLEMYNVHIHEDYRLMIREHKY